MKTIRNKQVCYWSNKAALIFITIILLLLTGYLYTRSSFSFRFVDEEYNFTIGNYLLKKEILYDDIITNHQPITHIFSAYVQKSSKPNSIYFLVKRHRGAIAVWSLIWSIIFIIYFGLSALLFTFVYEVTKSYLFGNLFLAESLVVYPLLFLYGVIIYKKSLVNPLLVVFSGICIGICLFLLTPIWPALFLFILLFFTRQKKYFDKSLLYLLVGVLITLVFIFKYSSLPGYIDYIYQTLTYTIPTYHGSESWILTILKSLITPLLSFVNSELTPTNLLIRVFSLLLITNLIFLILRRRFRETLIIICLLGLTNIRFVQPGTGHYSGFHMLPWFSVLLFISLSLSLQNLKQKVGILFKMSNILLILLIIILSVNYAKSVFLQQEDTQKNYLIHYSTYIDRGEIIKVMKDTSDTLFVSRDSWMVYWQSDINHLPKLFGYYPWMSGIPSLKSLVLDQFHKNPPTFLYCDNCIGSELERFLNKYSVVKKK